MITSLALWAFGLLVILFLLFWQENLPRKSPMPLAGHPEIRVNKPQSAQRIAESTETLEKPLCPLFFLCVLCGLKTMQT